MILPGFETSKGGGAAPAPQRPGAAWAAGASPALWGSALVRLGGAGSASLGLLRTRQVFSQFCPYRWFAPGSLPPPSSRGVAEAAQGTLRALPSRPSPACLQPRGAGWDVPAAGSASPCPQTAAFSGHSHGCMARLAVWRGWLYGRDGGTAEMVVRQIRERHNRAPQGAPGWHEGWTERACSIAFPVTPLGVS